MSAELKSVPLHDQVDECARRLDAIQSIAELLSIASGADAITDAIVSNPQRLTYAWDGIALLGEDAQQHLHGIS